jgi:hypothetical protein
MDNMSRIVIVTSILICHRQKPIDLTINNKLKILVWKSYFTCFLNRQEANLLKYKILPPS